MGLPVPPRLRASLPISMSLPLLPIWMNVASLNPWLLDFHTAWFSGGSGCYMFWGLVEIFSVVVEGGKVSTYTSILTRTLYFFNHFLFPYWYKKWIHIYLFYTLIYNPILLYLVAPHVPPWAVWSSFRYISVSLWHKSILLWLWGFFVVVVCFLALPYFLVL